MKKITKEEFIKKAIDIHGNQYNYDEVNYINSFTNIKILCKKHNTYFYPKPNNHLHKNKPTGCPICSYELRSNQCKTSLENFINKANQIHNYKYNYSQVNYLTARKNVIIICPLHGKFNQVPDTHLSGSECKKCGLNKIKKYHEENPIGWTITNWKQSALKSKNFDSFKIYIIKCFNEFETFIKIGRTYSTINQRFNNKYLLPYNYKILYYISGDAETIFKYENKLKNYNKQFKYIPKLEFGGRFECFKEVELI